MHTSEKEIETPIDMMTWDYYQYVKEHPIQKWDISTKILFAGKDTFQTLEVMEGFANKFNCALTVSQNSEHPFMAEGDAAIVEKWLWDNL